MNETASQSMPISHTDWQLRAAIASIAFDSYPVVQLTTC